MWGFGPKAMPPSYRDTVRRVAEELKPPTVDEELSARYAAEIEAWQDEHWCTRGDFTDGQWSRFLFWTIAHDTEHARGLWLEHVRPQFARYLFLTRRIGVDDGDE